jgi:hypothetical protein
MRFFLIPSYIVSLSISCLAQECVFPSASTDESTRAGANMLVTNVEKKSVRVLSGLVEDANGKPISGALIEVFDNPSWIINDAWWPEGNQKRMIGCETTEAGLFTIKGLEKGAYEIRVSVGPGYNVSHVYVRVDPKRGKRKSLRVTVEVGT